MADFRRAAADSLIQGHLERAQEALTWAVEFDKDGGSLMQMEGFDRAGKLIKRFQVVSAQKIENRWYLKQMRVETVDPHLGRVTGRTYLEINK